MKQDLIVTQPSYSYIRQKELLQILPFLAATLWRKVKEGSFIRPVKLSDRITAWDRNEVSAWLNAKESNNV